MAQILTICMTQFGFEKSHGNRNFGFDFLASVRIFKNRIRTEIQFPHIPNINTIQKHHQYTFTVRITDQCITKNYQCLAVITFSKELLIGMSMLCQS